MKATAKQLGIDIARRPITSEREPLPQYPLGTGEVYAKNYRALSGEWMREVYDLGPTGTATRPNPQGAASMSDAAGLETRDC